MSFASAAAAAAPVPMAYVNMASDCTRFLRLNTRYAIIASAREERAASQRSLNSPGDGDCSSPSLISGLSSSVTMTGQGIAAWSRQFLFLGGHHALLPE